MTHVKKILITDSGKKFFVRDTGKDVHTQFGYVRKEVLSDSDVRRVTTNMDKEMFVFDPRFVDLYQKMKRNAQMIPLKDIGFIVSETGLNKKSVVVDAGAGSGGLSCFLAHLVKKVVTYDIREDFISVVKGNIEFLGLTNITVKHKNIFDGIDEKNVDVVTLDVPDPWRGLDSVSKALSQGGFLISYSPTIPQVMDFVRSVKEHEDFIYIRTVEQIEREWDVDDRKVRPKSVRIGHSGFLSVCRRV